MDYRPLSLMETGSDTLFNVGGFSATTVHVYTWLILVRYPALAEMVMLNLSPHCR